MSYCLTLTAYYDSAVHTPMKYNDSGEKKFVDKLINDFFFQNYYCYYYFLVVVVVVVVVVAIISETRIISLNDYC